MQMQEQPNLQKKALDVLKGMDSQVIVDALLSATHSKRNQVIRLLRVAPEFTLETLATPQMLQDNGIWQGPHGWDDL